MVDKIALLFDRTMVLQIAVRCIDTQCIIGQFLYDQTPLFWPIQGDHDVGLAPRERERPRKRDQLNNEFGMSSGESAEMLRQEVITQAIGRSYPDCAGDRVGCPLQLRAHLQE